MSYTRTKEIREKQSKTMKNRTQSYDWSSIDKKRKQTLKERNKKSGRKQTVDILKIKCPSCGNIFETKNKSKIYCNQVCYNESKKGKSFLPFDFDWSKRNFNTPDRLKFYESRRNPKFSEYRKYRNIVSKLSEQTYVLHKEVINPDNHPRTKCGVDGGYQLDHVKSVKQSFLDGDKPEYVSRLENLQLLPWKENLLKR